MLKKIIQEQRRFTNYYFEHLDLEASQKILDACLQCRGLIVLTGVGKSGIIAEKIAMTFISTGTKALYLPPTNFLHGDIGILSSNDLLIFMSKSGETEELLNLIPFARKRKATLIAMVSHPHSRLAKACDLSIDLPVEKELCPFGLAPTTSTTVQLLFGDMLAVALMEGKGFSLEEFAMSHPSGTLGKKMTLTVEEIMFKGDQIPRCSPHDKLIDQLVELSNKKCGCLLVVDSHQKLQGIFTDGDLRRALQSQGPAVLEKKMEALMTASAIWTTKEALAHDALKLMQKDSRRWILVLPVLENGKVIGILRMHDIIQAGLS